MLDKVDKMLENLVELAYKESETANQFNKFNKDLIEACGIVISLAYGRWGKKNDK